MGSRLHFSKEHPDCHQQQVQKSGFVTAFHGYPSGLLLCDCTADATCHWEKQRSVAVIHTADLHSTALNEWKGFIFL